jgi:hypothetical protein
MFSITREPKLPATASVLNGVFGEVNRGSLGMCQKLKFCEYNSWQPRQITTGSWDFDHLRHCINFALSYIFMMASQSLQDRINILTGNLQGAAEDMHIYEKIFEDQKMIPILNKIAPRLFVRIKIALSDAVFLAMARITDGATTRTRDGERKNISFAGVRDDLKSEGYDIKHVNDAVTDLTATANHIRTYRSKCIAHLDDEIIRNEISLAPEGGFPLENYLNQSQIFS